MGVVSGCGINLLGCSQGVLSPQIVNVDNEAPALRAYHFTNLPKVKACIHLHRERIQPKTQVGGTIFNLGVA